MIAAMLLIATTLTGVVHDISGAVVPGASVVVRAAGPGSGEQRTITGPDGRFAVDVSGSGEVTGVVRDSTGAVVRGADVAARGVNRGESRAVTADDGRFVLEAPERSFDLHVKAVGFGEYVQKFRADAQSGLLFVKTSNQAHVGRVGKPDRSSANPLASEVDADYMRVGNTSAEFMNGLPLLKPPYGHVVAIDLNRGEIKWRVPFGDTPSLRRHPALKDVSLPAQLGVAGAPGLIATRGGLLFVGGGDAAFHALDMRTGAEVWRATLARRTNATPMTYRTKAGRQFVVVATGQGDDAALIAFALAGSKTSSSGGRW